MTHVIKDFIKGMSNYKPLVFIKDECVYIRLNEEGIAGIYQIGLDQITTYKDLVKWILHLTDKTWIKPIHISQLITHVCHHKQWKVYDI